MSVACNTDKSFCYHEPLADLKRWQEVYDLWAYTEYEFVGISDSALGFHLCEILETAGPRVLVIDRDQAEVAGSLAKLFGVSAERYCEVLLQRIAPHRLHPLVKVVQFEELKYTSAVMDCMAHLMPGNAPDYLKLAQLQKMNIQADLGTVKAAAAKRKADIADLLGVDVIAALSSGE